ncbi:MAG: peptidoglycan endopeptidase [Armatimonadetes bacterium]|nr:peptidoglycan endopeptidase [Armatimonadota bacterium]
MQLRDFGKPVLLISLFAFSGAAASADVYTVRPGDNLTTIARRLGIPLQTLARKNPGLTTLQPGQKIQIPEGDSPSPRSASPSVKSRSNEKKRQADLRSRKLKAQLAQWVRYKKHLAREKALEDRNKKRIASANRKKRQLAEWKAYKKRLRLKQQLAEWKAYKKALAKKKLAVKEHERSAERKRTAALKRRQLRQWQAYLAKRQKMLAKARRERERREERSEKIVLKRGQYRRSLNELARAARETGNGGSESGGGRGLVRTALAYRGARYVFGASGNGAFDCSGFTRHVYRRVAGVSLPHSSREQYNYGRKVSRSDLKPGDLVFFHTDRPGISHVGIYMGDGKFVHAANPRRGVTTDSLNGGFYGSRLVGARRIRE